MSSGSKAPQMPGSHPRSISVLAYDPSWPLIFERLRSPIWEAVRDLAESVEHIGSTAVPGLAAKPIIDVDVIVPARSDMPAVIERLASIGYLHGGNLGIEHRDVFESPPDFPPHHLYACVRGSAALENHLMVRDCLRRDPAAADAYGELKKRLAEQYPDDPRGYGMGKTHFVLALLGNAGCSDATLRTIRSANLSRATA